MSVIQRLDQDIKTALKAKESEKLEALRMIKTAVKNKEIELIRELKEDEFIAVLSTMAKRHKDSIDQFEKAGRDELVAKEKLGLEVVESYLPKALGDDEVSQIIDDAISATGASGPKDMGAIMKAIKEKTAGRVDGKTLSQAVKDKLANL